MEQVSQYQPELEQQTERRPFDIGRLTNDQVIRLTDLLSAEADERYREGADDVDDLWYMLEDCICHHAANDPKRGEELLLALRNSESTYSRKMAIYCAARYGTYPYELASRVLLELLKDDEVNIILVEGAASSFEDDLPPDQAAEFEAKWGQVEREMGW